MNFPKLSIIVPSYNQGPYIEETILSIINQDYSNKELIIIDGGSTDNSVDIIKKYEQYIAYWVSEKDEGQSHAINKGFELATGDYIAWMNSDDIYYEHAFKKIFSTPSIEQYDFIYGPACMGEESANSICMNSKRTRTFSLFNLLHFFYSIDFIIPSQSVFVKKEFLKNNNIGFLNNDCHYCMDLEWYCRISMHKPAYYRYNDALSFFRINESTKTGSQKNKMQAEALEVLYKYRKYLKKNEEKYLLKLVLLEKLLRRIYKKQQQFNYKMFLKIMSKIPKEALSDRRFLGVCKDAILK